MRAHFTVQSTTIRGRRTTVSNIKIDLIRDGKRGVTYNYEKQRWVCRLLFFNLAFSINAGGTYFLSLQKNMLRPSAFYYLFVNKCQVKIRYQYWMC